jgi:hypothetical protein
VGNCEPHVREEVAAAGAGAAAGGDDVMAGVAAWGRAVLAGEGYEDAADVEE